MQWYHFTTDFDRVLLQLIDILNTLFKYQMSCRQLIFITERLSNAQKALQSLICYL